LSVEFLYSKANEIPYSKSVPSFGKASQIHIQPQAATIKQQVIISSGYTVVRQSVSLFERRVLIFESERDSYSKAVPSFGKASQIHIQPQAATTKQQVIISSGFTVVQQCISLFQC
jgi:K+ transporter